MAVTLWAGYVEKTAFLQLSLCILQSMSVFSPPYNFGIALWGLYCAYNLQGRAVFTYLVLLLASIAMDIVYCSVWGSIIHKEISGKITVEGGGANNAGLSFLIINMFAKLPAAFAAYKAFGELGGTWSLSQYAVDDSQAQDGAYNAPGPAGPPSDAV